MGWGDKNSFFPYVKDKEIIFESESSEVNGIIFARFILSSSFASLLLKLIDSRVFFLHIWHDSQSGKTAAMKFAVSVWGEPTKLMGSFNATSVGLERMAGLLKHTPFAIDELQILNDRRLSAKKLYTV